MMLLMLPKTRDWFIPQEVGDVMVVALLPPVVLLFVFGSLWASWRLRCEALSATPAMIMAPSIVVDATGYACLLCWGMSLRSGAGWLGAVTMTAALIASTVCLALITLPMRVRAMFLRRDRRARASMVSGRPCRP